MVVEQEVKDGNFRLWIAEQEANQSLCLVLDPY